MLALAEVPGTLGRFSGSCQGQAREAPSTEAHTRRRSQGAPRLPLASGARTRATSPPRRPAAGQTGTRSGPDSRARRGRTRPCTRPRGPSAADGICTRNRGASVSGKAPAGSAPRPRTTRRWRRSSTSALRSQAAAAGSMPPELAERPVVVGHRRTRVGHDVAHAEDLVVFAARVVEEHLHVAGE